MLTSMHIMSACRVVACVILATTARISTTPLHENTTPVNESSTFYSTTQVNVNSSMTTQSVATVDSWTWVEFPNPQRDMYKCGNDGVESWVCDPAGLLTAQEGSSLSFGLDIGPTLQWNLTMKDNSGNGKK